MTDFDTFLDQCNEEFATVPTKKTNKEFAREKFTCESCNGTGLWVGGTNRHKNSKCNTCHGKGYLVTSPEARRKAKVASANRKRRNIKSVQEENAAIGDGFLLGWLKEIESWNDFARSLMDQHRQGKRAWSEKQIDAARNMYSKMQAKKKAKEEKKQAAPEVDLAPIRQMFDTIIKNGYKRPMYRADGLRIKPGKDGSLYVLTEDRMEFGYYGEQPGYEGKIADLKFFASRAAAPDTLVKLQAIAEDPLGAAIRYGNATGRCACCGRELTKHESIKRGIGPICAERWGLGDAELGIDPKAAKAEMDEVKAKLLG